MCELLAMSCRYPAKLTFSLASLASHAQGNSKNRDGWGVAFHDGRDVALFREAGSVSDSALVKLLENEGPSAVMAIAHIRHATQGDIKLANTAPFVRELAGRMRSFAHNGNFPGIFQSPFFTSEDFHSVGETDSEKAFCALLGRMKSLEQSNSHPPSLRQRLETIADFALDLRKLGPANFLYADGDALFAHADRRLQAQSHQVLAPALYRWACPVNHFSSVVTDKPSLSDQAEQRVTLFSSVPLVGEAWQPLAEGEIVAVYAGEVVDTIIL